MSSSPTPATFLLDHLAQPPAEQLCYVHCNFCDTILAVGVPCSSLFKTVTVRCGHCGNLLSVNLRALLLPAAAEQLHFGHAFLPPASQHGLLVPLIQTPSLLIDQASANLSSITSSSCSSNSCSVNSVPAMSVPPAKAAAPPQELELPPKSAPSVNRPPEKRHRVPSAYNRFIKDEIQRIKAGNPDITHREAFSAAAKNWAHFPHIHFGLLPDQGLRKTTTTIRPQEGEDDMVFKDGLYTAAAAAVNDMGVTPF